MRLLEIDFLRGVAVLLVLFRHVPLPPGPFLGETPLRFLRAVGWAGVDLFFVLSGFLVSGLLFAEWRRHGSLRIGRFLVRRGCKIYPAFYVLLALTLADALWSGRALLDPRFVPALLSESLYVQNYLAGLWYHTWSLAVEEHFYLLLAIGFGLLARRQARAAGSRVSGDSSDPFRALPHAVAALAGAALALRMLATRDGTTYTVGEVYTPTHLRIDALGLGLLLGYLRHAHPSALTAFASRWRGGLALAAGALLAPLVLLRLETSRLLLTLGLTTIPLGFAILLLLALPAADGPAPRPWARSAPVRLLARIGTISYSVYLWHIPLLEKGHRFWDAALGALRPIPAGALLHAALYVAACIALGALAARAIEFPALAIRDRLFPSRTAPVEAAGGAPVATLPVEQQA